MKEASSAMNITRFCIRRCLRMNNPWTELLKDVGKAFCHGILLAFVVPRVSCWRLSWTELMIEEVFYYANRTHY